MRIYYFRWVQLIITLVWSNVLAVGQNNQLTITPLKNIKKYSTGSITKNSEQLKSDQAQFILNIDFGHLKGQEIILEENNLISKSYKLSIGLEKESSIHESLALSGYVDGHKSSDARITIFRGVYTGYIQVNSQTYYIEPLSRYTSTTSQDQHIIYNGRDVRASKNYFCAATEHKQRSAQAYQKKANSNNTCKKFELAIALDFAYIQKYNSTAEAIARSISIMNMVAGDFDDAFQSEIKFEIVEHYLSNCESCDPWGDATEVKELIEDFGLWANSGFTKTHDIGQLWSGKDLYWFDMGLEKYGVIGYAMNDAVCSPSRYQILEDYSSIDWNLRVLTSHEFGHNFGAIHDAQGSSFIMTPNVNNTEEWSSTSINIINNNISNYMCYASCNDDCNSVVVMDQLLSKDIIEAKDTIKNDLSLTIAKTLTLGAPNVTISSEFCVTSGIEFTIISEGCQ